MLKAILSWFSLEHLVGGFNLPLWKIWLRQLGWFFPIYGKIKHVPNHQPVIVWSSWLNSLNKTDTFFCRPENCGVPAFLRHCPNQFQQFSSQSPDWVSEHLAIHQWCAPKVVYKSWCSCVSMFSISSSGACPCLATQAIRRCSPKLIKWHHIAYATLAIGEFVFGRDGVFGPSLSVPTLVKCAWCAMVKTRPRHGI